MTARIDTSNLESAEQSASHTRRSLLRFAAGALGAAGLAAVAGSEAEAGKRRGATRTRADSAAAAGKRARCRPGKAIGRMAIPADGRPIETPVLEKGRTYRLRAEGFVGLANSDGSPALNAPAVDADYGFFRQGAPRPNDRVGGLDWGVAIDGKVPAWGDFVDDHHYAILVAGRGKPLTLELAYATDEFAPDGQGAIEIAIECA